MFSGLHQRSSSLKAQAIPLLTLDSESPSSFLRSTASSNPASSSSVDGNLYHPITKVDPILEELEEFENIDIQAMSTTPGKRDSPMSNYDADQEQLSLESKPLTPPNNLLARLKGEVDPTEATLPLTAYCFMTGFIDSVSFSAAFVWCGFQTGNGTQLALALARLFEGEPGQRDYSFHNADQLALTSILCFAFGASFGRIGDKIGCKTRLWLMLGTFLQSLFTMVAAVTIWRGGEASISDSRGDAVWTNALSYVCVAFLSMSLGLQGIMGKRVNTQFTTTIVLTTTWCELMTEPSLFKRGFYPARDHKILAIVVLFIGGFTGRCLVDQIGSAGTLGVGCGIRFLIALSWYFVKGKATA
ncbi:hypothetical protein FIBSPDRAFT_922152 [Athelia psychrophila]|uniref:DUF1275 domain protein n=1 Tax=Athelia psychrophila TaxID=1759441 RepID=A0A166AC55_9AGAM|nr:hypothetical protein FIBSPDRAFT_922152 [Fibularhizoctonia sp. CBS 109695]